MVLNYLLIFLIGCASAPQVIMETGTAPALEVTDTIKDPLKKSVLKSTLSSLQKTIETQNQIITKYQVDLEDARLKAEEAQQAKGFVDLLTKFFYLIIALAVIYLIGKVMNRIRMPL
jgi:hypothetical protein